MQLDVVLVNNVVPLGFLDDRLGSFFNTFLLFGLSELLLVTYLGLEVVSRVHFLHTHILIHVGRALVDGVLRLDQPFDLVRCDIVQEVFHSLLDHDELRATFLTLALLESNVSFNDVEAHVLVKRLKLVRWKDADFVVAEDSLGLLLKLQGLVDTLLLVEELCNLQFCFVFLPHFFGIFALFHLLSLVEAF